MENTHQVAPQPHPSGQLVMPDTSPPVSPAPPSPPPATPPHAKGLSMGIQIALLVMLFVGGLAAGLAFFYQKNATTTNIQAAAEIADARPTLDRIKSSGKIVFGTDATYAPMEYPDENGNLIGYDIDLANRIGEKLNLKVEYKVILFDDIFQELEDKKIDAIISSVSITDERKAKYAFSDPYLNAGQVIIARTDNTDIKTTADLRGRRIAIQSNTTGEPEARKFTEPENIMLFEDSILATEAVVSGRADVVFLDLTNAKSMTSTHPNLKIVSDPFTNEEYGIVMRRGEDDLTNEINGALNSLRQQGVLVLLKQKWLE